MVKTSERFMSKSGELENNDITKPKDYSAIKSLCHFLEKFKSCVRLELVVVLREFVSVD